MDTGLRLDGLPALGLWDLIVSVLGHVSRVSDRSEQADNDVHKRHKSRKKMDVMEDIDSVLSNVQSARQEALLYVFEDNEAVIKMIIKGRSPTVRHVSRTHRVALDWMFGLINLDSKIQVKYIDTKIQVADILTKGNFKRDEWNHLLSLFNISHFTSTICSAAMAKRVPTRIRRRTNHSKIKANDESDRECLRSCRLQLHQTRGRHGTDIKILGNLLWKMIDQGNLIDSLQQVIRKWIKVVLGLLKSGKVRLRRTIDQGNLMTLLGMRCNKFAFIMENLFSTEMRNP